MRPLIASPLLGLLLLGGCGQPQHLLSEPPGATALASPSSSTQGVPLHIGNGFTSEEEAQIAAAAGDWNRRGTVRFDLARQTYNGVQPGVWTILKRNPAEMASTDEWRVAPIAVTQRYVQGGGTIVVDTNRLGNRDLRTVLAREMDAAMTGSVEPSRAARVATVTQ